MADQVWRSLVMQFYNDPEQCVSDPGICSALPPMYRWTFFILGYMESILLGATLVQLSWLFWTSKHSGNPYRAKKVFHLLLSFTMLGRSIWLFLSAFVLGCGPLHNVFPNSLFIFWNHLFEVMFFTAYLLLLIFWLEAYHSLTTTAVERTRGPFSKPVKLFFIISLGVVAVTIVVFVFLCFVWPLSDPKPGHRIMMVDIAFGGAVDVMFLITALGFFIYGLRLWFLLKSPHAVPSRNKKIFARKIAVVTAVCTACFVFRIAVSLYSLVHDKGSQKGFDVSWVLFFFYFFLPEVVTTVAMLYLLRTPLNKKSSSVQSADGFQYGKP